MPQSETGTDTAEPVTDHDAQAATDADTDGSSENGSVVPWTSITKPTDDTETLAAMTAASAAEPGADDMADASLPLDQVFAVLKNERRRRVLGMLKQTDDKLSLSDLAERIAALENDKPIEQLTSSERKCVYVGLYQCHLPKMDSMDVIEFNKSRGTVARAANTDAVYDYLETAAPGAEPDWYRYSTILSVGGAAALGTALLVDPMTPLPVIDGTVGCLVIVFVAYGLGAFVWTHRAD
ncbi:hypothetical protein EGH24_11900 [Halonotius terrestris]|uniref:DUF7344 domain-containing protein n=1 Tax=Halonotius terrestris TaxID=2487750 RepID=A0A8J8PAF5_9EURY|nr:hypothetical protein [Halonotius terrestris]TQQ79327.1 hypothetical protein EGH24_11900 [Halonotius terrestris]